jgi:beta-N-acetylhexosaminidase
MSLRTSAGQLVMVGVPADSEGPSPAETEALRSGVGNLILTGRSDRGVDATARLVHRLRVVMRRGPTGLVRPEVALDQEGGQVQVLTGPGFADMPTAQVQGTWSQRHVRRAADRWGRQLVRARVTLNLSPVLDVVPGGEANEPIGHYDRGFGDTPGWVTRMGTAFVRGHRRAGVAVSIKHFPGLGRATGNTDVTADVVDQVTTRHDRFLRPFRAAIHEGAAYVMMSSARYTRLDARRPAAFSPVVVRGLLRGQLGFDGVVISDDLGNAVAVQHMAPGRRAVAFIRAGGDMALSVDAVTATAMVDALVRRARSHRTFRAKIDRAVLRVLRRKADAGLVCS